MMLYRQAKLKREEDAYLKEQQYNKQQTIKADAFREHRFLTRAMDALKRFVILRAQERIVEIEHEARKK